MTSPEAMAASAERPGTVTIRHPAGDVLAEISPLAAIALARDLRTAAASAGLPPRPDIERAAELATFLDLAAERLIMPQRLAGEMPRFAADLRKFYGLPAPPTAPPEAEAGKRTNRPQKYARHSAELKTQIFAAFNSGDSYRKIALAENLTEGQVAGIVTQEKARAAAGPKAARTASG